MKKRLFLIFTLLIVAVLGCFIYYNRNKVGLIASNKVESQAKVETQAAEIPTYVTIDINPSIELAVDKDDKVVDVTTLNDDADIAYSDINLIGNTVDAATESIVNNAIDLGYVTEISDNNSVNVTTYAEDETRRASLNKKFVDSFNKNFEKRKIYTLMIENGLDTELKSKADSYNISYGKMLLISRAMKLDSTLVESDLVKLSVKDIQSKIKTQEVARREELKKTLNENKQDFKDVKLQRIATAKAKLQLAKDALENSNKNSSTLTDEQKQAIVEQRKEQIKKQIQDAKDKLNQNGNTLKEDVKQNIKNKYLLKGNQ